jgi:hypothetical protein
LRAKAQSTVVDTIGMSIVPTSKIVGPLVLPSANPVLENIGLYTPCMMVIGHSLLNEDKDCAICCVMFIDLLDDDV